MIVNKVTKEHDPETIQMIIQDFCARQSNLIMREVFDFIENNFADMRSLTSKNPELFEVNKQNVDDYIKRVYESGYHNRNIRISKPLQDYLYEKILNLEKSKIFIKEFNKNVIPKGFLDSCKKTEKLFKRKQ